MGVQEDIKVGVLSLRKSIDVLNSQVAKIENQMLREEVTYVQKLEDYCLMLRNAVLDLNLKLPPIVSFERYLTKIADISNVLYVMELLHECWIFLHPDFLFQRLTKVEMSPDKISVDQMLNLVFDDSNVAVIDRNDFNPLKIEHAKAIYSLSARLKSSYGDYMENLLSICKRVCQSFNIVLSENFTTSISLTSHKELSVAQIDSVFTVMADEGLMTNTTETRAAFRAMFDNVLTAVETRIEWLDKAKNKSPNYASLYVMFDALGVEMSTSNKDIICRVFTTPNGGINPNQIKVRDESKELNELRNKVKNALHT